MKIIQGWILTANEKTAAVSFCDSPYHMSVSVEAWRLINLHPDALAVALAIIVLPQPGGPNNKTPERTKSKELKYSDSCNIWTKTKQIFTLTSAVYRLCNFNLTRFNLHWQLHWHLQHVYQIWLDLVPEAFFSFWFVLNDVIQTKPEV